MKGQGIIYDLYELINAIEDSPQQKAQELTKEEKALIASLRVCFEIKLCSWSQEYVNKAQLELSLRRCDGFLQITASLEI